MMGSPVAASVTVHLIPPVCAIVIKLKTKTNISVNENLMSN